MNSEREIVAQIRRELNTNLNNIIKYMPIIVPVDATDKKALAIGKDMLECMVSDINGPAISEVIDIDRLVQDWEKVSSSLSSIYNVEVQRTIEHIVELCDAEGDDDDEFDE